MAKVNGSAEILDMGQARARLRPADLKASEYPNVGVYFSAVREAAGYSIEDIAARTHIKAAYLNAIELMRLDDLPSRPFALGFVKTYAEALGVDASAAVAKFKETTGLSIAEARIDHQPAEPQLAAVEERERPLLTLIGFIAVLGFILFCAIMIAIPKQTSEPYRLNQTAIPGALPARGADVASPAAETPAAGAPASTPPLILEARLIEGVDPVYPRRCEAGAAELERVEIAFNVSAAGTVVGERIASSTNSCLNDAALNAARLWRYAPRTVDGAPQMAYDLRRVFEFRRP